MVNRKRFLNILLLFIALILVLTPMTRASAQTYRFTLPVYEVEAYIEEDGSVTLYYYMEFLNDSGASPLDFVDLALPYANYSLRNIEATINGNPMPEVNDSAYVHGAELALKQYAIPAGQTGTVIATVRGITDILFPYDQDDRENYINFQFEPNYFGSEYDRSRNTAYRMTIILPPGVGTEDGVYYEPEKWPGDTISEASTTTDGRVYYSWYTENANVHTAYRFGAAFPASAVPETAIIPEEEYNPPSSGGISGLQRFLNCLRIQVPFWFFVAISILVAKRNKKRASARKLEYLPPKMSVAGKGIKRGLTAVEAGILLAEPLDKVLTMILFGLLKKQAVEVVSKDPMQIKPTETLPEGLYEYEEDFIKAFTKSRRNEQRTALQNLSVKLVKSVEEKMKGFSPQETKAYYKDIVRRAWMAVEGAQTPEIKSAQYDHTLEWTMLDDNFNARTQQTFLNQPVFIPRWWHLYNPGYRPAYSTGTSGGLGSAAPSSSGGSSSKPSFSMPNIPGSDFAASIINGAAGFSAGVIGDLTGFTGAVTSRTNPVPVSSSSSGSSGFRGGGGGGSSCACACACAGCACACAGGGR